MDFVGRRARTYLLLDEALDLESLLLLPLDPLVLLFLQRLVVQPDSLVHFRSSLLLLLNRLLSVRFFLG